MLGVHRPTQRGKRGIELRARSLERAGSELYAALASLGRTVHAEHPGVEWRSIGLARDQPGSPSDALALALSELGAGADVEIKYEHGQRWTRRLSRLPASALDAAPLFKPGAVHVVFGGLGGLGARTAEHAFEAGASHVVLCARS